MKQTLGLSISIIFLLGLAQITAGAPRTAGQPFARLEKITASNFQDAAEFGASLALSPDGQVMVVGAPLQDVGGSGNQGQATVFQRNGDDTWSEAQILTAVDGAADDHFGETVAIADGPDYTIVVGAPDHDEGANTGIGAAYVFSYDGLAWDAGAKLAVSDADASFNDHRGRGLAIAAGGGSIYVGAPGLSVGADTPGAVYVFDWNGATWEQNQRLLGPTGAEAGMGRHLLVNDDNNLLFAAGAYAPSGPVITYGAVHVYTKPAATWIYDERLTPSDSSEFDDFGHSMAISDDEGFLLIGAPQLGEGAAYMFVPDGGTWVESQILPRPADYIYGFFGASVSMDGAGETAVIGAWLNGSGGIHHYERSGSSWGHTQALRLADGSAEHLGIAVALSKNADLVVGGARSAHSGPDVYDLAGAVYTFVPGHQLSLPMLIQ